MDAIDEIPDVPDDEVDEACGEFRDDGADVDYLAIQGSDRLWLRAVQPLVQLATKLDPSLHERVRWAVNDMAVAACERAARILRSDLPPVDWDAAPDDEA